MKQIFFAFLLISAAFAQTDGCNADRQYQDNYLKICVSQSLYTETDDDVSMRMSYISTGAEVITTDFVELTDPNCDVFENNQCDYWNINDDIQTILWVEVSLDGDDGTAFQTIDFHYNSYTGVQNLDGTAANNDCDTIQTWYVGDLYEVLIDGTDLCEAARWLYDPAVNGVQYATKVYATTADGTHTCDTSFNYASGQAHDTICDSCYYQQSGASCTPEVIDTCNWAGDTDTFFKACIADYLYSDTTHEVTLSVNYQDTSGATQTYQFPNLVDSAVCDIFVVNQCDFFELPISDVAHINYADVGCTGTDGVGWSEFVFQYSGGSASLVPEVRDSNDCASVYGFAGEDPEFIWIDIDDTCEQARIQFGAADATGAQATEKIYAITDCNCDKVASLGYFQTETDDAESCHQICDVQLETVCDEVTVFSECEYGGDSLIVTDSVDCLDWAPLSICVPAGKTATIFDLCWYEEELVTLTENESCFSTATWSFLEKKQHLKGKNNKIAHIEVS